MPRDAVRLRARLARHLDDLYRLQVIEAAEEVVRRRHLQTLASQLAGLCDDLARTRQHLDTARNSSDLRQIVEAEERVCETLRQTTVMQRQTGEDIRAAKRAHNAYLAQRRRLIARIDQLRRLIA